MGFFDLVEQDHPVGTAADGFGELATFFVAHVARRGAKQARDGVLFAVFTHIHPHQGVFIVKQEFGQRLGQLGLANAGGANKDERANRAARVFQPGARAADRIGDGVDGFFLTDDALVQAVFHVQQFFGLGFHHLGDRNAGPLGDDLGNVLASTTSSSWCSASHWSRFSLNSVLEAQALGFLLGGAFVIALQTGLLFFGSKPVDFAFHLL